MACVLAEDFAGFQGAGRKRRPSLLRKSTPVTADRRKHTRALYLHPSQLETEMLVSLSFGQVREAGLFAWREDHLLYTPTLDAILTVWRRNGTQGDAGTHLDVRSSLLDGTELDTRLGWHHLRECRCVYCRDARLAMSPDAA